MLEAAFGRVLNSTLSVSFLMISIFVFLRSFDCLLITFPFPLCLAFPRLPLPRAHSFFSLAFDSFSLAAGNGFTEAIPINLNNPAAKCLCVCLFRAPLLAVGGALAAAVQPPQTAGATEPAILSRDSCAYIHVMDMYPVTGNCDQCADYVTFFRPVSCCVRAALQLSLNGGDAKGERKRNSTLQVSSVTIFITFN